MIDAHVHVWDAARLAGYSWMTDEMASIRRPFTLDDLRTESAPHPVRRVVLVQTCSSVEETEAFLALAATDGLVGGVVGWVDLADPGVGETIERLRATSGGRRLVGLRHQAHDEPDAGWLVRADVLRGLAAVQEADLVFDLLVRTRELPAALEMAHRLPDLRLVVDHAAKPPLAAGGLDAWSTALAPFAELEQVACKLSGLVTEADWGAWTPDDLVPVVDRLLECFGEKRLLFGSDWPVCRLAASYDEVVVASDRALGALTAPARRRIFGTNAERIYALPA